MEKKILFFKLFRINLIFKMIQLFSNENDKTKTSNSFFQSNF